MAWGGGVKRLTGPQRRNEHHGYKSGLPARSAGFAWGVIGPQCSVTPRTRYAPKATNPPSHVVSAGAGWAQIAKDNSVTIYTIGYGATQCCGGTCDVDSCLLKEVASGSDKYYYASSSTVIGEAFNAIGQRIGHRLLK